MRQRNNNYVYDLDVVVPNGHKDTITDLVNLVDIAKAINKTYFNGFNVVSRSMVNNWLYYPDQPRRAYAENFTIHKRLKA